MGAKPSSRLEEGGFYTTNTYNKCSVCDCIDYHYEPEISTN
jgi:hypothetical protein